MKLYPAISGLVICLLGCATPKKPDTAEDAFQPPESIQDIIDKANAGDPEAQLHMASLHFDGFGVERNYEKVFHWAKKAAEQGQARGMYIVAMHHGYGIGGEKDLVKARHWLRKGADHGNVPSMHSLAGMLARGQGGTQTKWRH